MTSECDECGNDLHVSTVDKPNIDWVNVVCSNCGNITDVSMIRLASSVKKEEK